MNVVAPSPTALKALPWDDPSDAAEEPFPARGLVEEVITRTGVPASVLAAALEDCLRNGSDLGDELVSHGVREDVLAKAIASAIWARSALRVVTMTASPPFSAIHSAVRRSVASRGAM